MLVRNGISMRWGVTLADIPMTSSGMLSLNLLSGMLQAESTSSNERDVIVGKKNKLMTNYNSSVLLLPNHIPSFADQSLFTKHSAQHNHNGWSDQ